MQTVLLEQVWQFDIKIEQFWQILEDIANLSSTHDVHTAALEHIEQFSMRELHNTHNPPCRVKPELH